MTGVERAHAGDFDAFYRANYRDILALAYTSTGNLTEAQDLAQEAFCRVWQRWRQLARYDNPAAWVRRVTFNLATSRWRRAWVARAYQLRQRADAVPALEPDHVAVVAALRRLPDRHRRVVVLHHLMDLPVTEIAEELGVPAGTVKSWLHRGRAELAVLLDDREVDADA